MSFFDESAARLPLAAAASSGLLVLLRYRRNRRPSTNQYDVTGDPSQYTAIQQRKSFDPAVPSAVLFGGPLEGGDKWLGGEMSKDGTVRYW